MELQGISFLWPLLLLFSCSVMSDSLWLHELQHARLPCPSPSPRACSNLCQLRQWCHPAVSSSVVPFSYNHWFFPTSESLPVSQLLYHVAKVLDLQFPVDIQGWFPLGMTGLISLLSKGLSTVFLHTTVQKRQFFTTQHSLWSNSHIHTWLLRKNHSFDYTDLCQKSNVSAF